MIDYAHELGDRAARARSSFAASFWDEEHGWRTFSANESTSAMLANRVETALRSMPIDSEDEACEALLTMAGSHLLARSCDHGPGECDSEVGRH